MSFPFHHREKTGKSSQMKKSIASKTKVFNRKFFDSGNTDKSVFLEFPAGFGRICSCGGQRIVL